jgi:Ornithine/acetylornithine aminotransferase
MLVRGWVAWQDRRSARGYRREKYASGARRAGMPLSRKIPFNNVDALETALDETVAALILEPVQGMAGARGCSPEFLAAARRAADRVGAVLIFDEVQCGVGRVGTFTAAESFGVTPDILTLAKGLGVGFPVAAIGGSTAVMSMIAEGRYSHSGTYNANVVACAAVSATMDVLAEPGLFERQRDWVRR